MRRDNNRDRVFMSYKHRRIWYRMVNLELIYMVANGDGTDTYFTCWEDAIKWIDEHTKTSRNK